MEKKLCKNVAIIGSSIAGCSLALLLSKKGIHVKIFEQKSESEISNKVCANIVTESFLNLSEKLEINPQHVINKRFYIAKFCSKNNSIKLTVKDYEIDRKKLIAEMIKKARDAGAEFYFNTRFLDFRETEGGYEVVLQEIRKRKKIIETADYLVGADGALSEVAKKSGLWSKRLFWLAMQTRIPKKSIARTNLSANEYCIFFIPELGYYSYLFPSKESIVVGTLSNPRTARQNFDRLMNFLKISRCKRESALIPIPKKIRFRKGRIFIAGDAACQTKFSGGGIVQAIESAFAIADIITRNNNNKARELGGEILLHQLIANTLSKMQAEDFDILFNIARKQDLQIPSRDELRKWTVRFVLKNPALLRFLPKLF